MLRIAAFAIIFSLAPLASAADGPQLYAAQCKLCHGPNGGGSPLGPSLKGVAGRKIASGMFAYSNALKVKVGNWTDPNLDAWLKAPTKFAPGTKMFVAVSADANRAAILAYLKTLN